MHYFYSVFVASLLGLSTITAFAFERDHEAHEHGHAQLMIVQEKNELQLRLISPAMNIVGFEHQASTAAQRHEIEEAKQTLMQPAVLLTLNEEAACVLEHAGVASSLLTEQSAHHEDEHHEDEHHEEGHHDSEHAGEVHSEFVAEYHFECAKPERLSGIDLSLFGVFPGIEELDVQVVTGQVQTQVELGRDQDRIAW